jgi:hypothetical protein
MLPQQLLVEAAERLLAAGRCHEELKQSQESMLSFFKICSINKFAKKWRSKNMFRQIIDHYIGCQDKRKFSDLKLAKKPKILITRLTSG